MNKVVYRNLGANRGERMMYIRSTDIESKNWVSLLMSFPDEALYHMTRGRKIVIEDRCNKEHGKVQRIFCPAFSDFLRILSGVAPKHKSLQAHVGFALNAYGDIPALRRKYDFFKSRLRSHHVRGRTIKMNVEPSVW